MNQGRRKVGLALAAGLLALVVLVAGVTYPRPAVEVVELGYTNFTGLEVAAPTTYATGTPAVVFDSAGLGTILELRDAQTPVFRIRDGGAADFVGQGMVQDINVENLMLTTVISVSVPYTPASGTIATVADGEMWWVHAVFTEVTSNWNCTGDDCTLDIGDGTDPNGLLDLDDGELQAADTEGTGAPAGWQGFMSTDTRGAFLANGHGFIYAPSGAAETIDFAVGGTDPAAGQAYVYVVYTRFK